MVTTADPDAVADKMVVDLRRMLKRYWACAGCGQGNNVRPAREWQRRGCLHYARICSSCDSAVGRNRAMASCDDCAAEGKGKRS